MKNDTTNIPRIRFERVSRGSLFQAKLLRPIDLNMFRFVSSPLYNRRHFSIGFDARHAAVAFTTGWSEMEGNTSLAGDFHYDQGGPSLSVLFIVSLDLGRLSLGTRSQTL